MKRLLLVDVFRGQDSTGMAAIRSSGEIVIAKVPSHPFDLFDMGKFKAALNATNSTVFLGHNRSATRGAINHANSHPFEVDHIIGAHNGTLMHSSTSDLEKALDEDFPVDSLALITAMARLGVKTAIEMCRDGSDSTTGAWSLVWYDKKEDSINFLRNKHRPMWYAFTKDFKTILWASEWQMIKAAVELGVGTELYMEEKTGHKFWSTEEDVHYKFVVGELAKGGDARPKATVQKIKGKEPMGTSHGTSGGTHNPLGFGTSAIEYFPEKKSGTKTAKSGSHSGYTDTPNIIHLLGDLNRPLAGYIKQEEFEALAKYGCSWCNADVEWGDKGLLIFERDGVIICPKCLEESRKERDATKIFMKPLSLLP